MSNKTLIRGLLAVAVTMASSIAVAADKNPKVFFDVTDGHAELIARDGLILDILRLTERLGIAFDSPTLLLDRNGQASPALEIAKGLISPSA